jgi:hypothetical protein
VFERGDIKLLGSRIKWPGVMSNPYLPPLPKGNRFTKKKRFRHFDSKTFNDRKTHGNDGLTKDKGRKQ